MKLHDRTILVTGASEGIGAAAARALASCSVRLALLARSGEKLDILAGELADLPALEVLTLPADVSKVDQVREAVHRTTQRFGAIDILVNNAGVGMRGAIGRTDGSLARRLFEVNFWGAVHCIDAVVPGMVIRRDGLVINVASIVGYRALPNSGFYCASKSAMRALSEAMRIELAPHNVRVVTFLPGITNTAFKAHELTGDASDSPRSPLPTSTARKAAWALLRACEKEPREAYVTRLDQLFVTVSRLFPRVLDYVFSRSAQNKGLW